MGRRTTGAVETIEALRIELSFLIKQGYFKRGDVVNGSMVWSTDGEPETSAIHIQARYPHDGPPELSFIYAVRNNETGKVTNRHDRVYMQAVPSNLGSGEVLYFLCPQTGQRCRILYRCYGSDIWKSRTAYQNRIYYPTQRSSKISLYNDRYWRLDSHITKLTKKRIRDTYRGKPTRRAARFDRLCDKQDEADVLRWTPAGMPLGLRRAIFDELGKVKPLFP